MDDATATARKANIVSLAVSMCVGVGRVCHVRDCVQISVCCVVAHGSQ